MSLGWQPFLTVWALLAANVASPGPNVLNTIATALGSGRSAAMGSAVGVAIGIACWCLGMSLGVAALFSVAPVMRTVLTVVAVGLLVWFSTRYLRQSWTTYQGARRGLPAERDGLSFAAATRRSLAVNALNPKALTSWIAILAVFPAARAGAPDIALLCLGACAVSFAIHTIYALAFSTPPAARLYVRHGWIATGLAGLFFAGFAVKLALGLAY